MRYISVIIVEKLGNAEQYNGLIVQGGDTKGMTEIPMCPKGLNCCIQCEDWNEDIGCMILAFGDDYMELMEKE